MNEEINWRESVLSGAELESVSGAGSDEDHEIDVRSWSICKDCQIISGKHCGGSRSLLRAYLKEHGTKSVQGYHDCPYYIP